MHAPPGSGRENVGIVRRLSRSLCSIALLGCVLVHGAEMQPVRASIRSDGTLLLDGRPVFPVGIRIEGEGEEHARIAEAGFNVLLTSGAVGSAFYESAARQGLRVIAGHYVWATFRGADREQIDLHDSALRQAYKVRNMAGRTLLEALADVGESPALFAWNTCEEPHARMIEPLEVVYELIKSHKPHHLVVGLIDDSGWAQIFQKSADVVIVDCYPYRGRLSQPAMLIYERVREARERSGNKPIWFMPQLYPPSYFSKDSADDLTPQILREACFLGLTAGAKGIVMYSYYALGDLAKPDGARRWRAVRTVTAELRKLEAIVCDGRPLRSLPLNWRTDSRTSVPAIPAQVLELYGRVYVIVANPTDASLSAGLQAGFVRLNPCAFDASVFVGGDGLTVGTASSEGREYPMLTVRPHGAGVFELRRRPMAP